MVMKSVLLLTLASLLVISCQKKEADDSPVGNGHTTVKDTLSHWKIGNEAWGYKLDVNANLDGTTFTLIIKYADNSELQCANSKMFGGQSSGTYELPGPCVATGGMAVGQETVFTFVGVGSYANSGSALEICRPGGGSCLDYH